jgi:hypothetical protein
MSYIGEPHTPQDLLLRALYPDGCPCDTSIGTEIRNTSDDDCYRLVAKELRRLNHEVDVARAAIRRLTKSVDSLRQLNLFQRRMI